MQERTAAGWRTFDSASIEWLPAGALILGARANPCLLERYEAVYLKRGKGSS